MSANTISGLADRGRASITDVISALHRHDGQLPAREQLVANYVKAHLEDISTLTIAELAREAGVSKPTVIRFCRSLGCDGFREFKLRLAQNLAVSLQYLGSGSGADSDSPSSAAAIDQVCNSVFATINSMRQNLDLQQVEQATHAIINCRQLLVAGIGGGSSMLAEEAANRFFRLGIPSTALSDSYMLQMRSATLRCDDVLLLISASGEADAIVAAAKVAEGYGATTICLSTPQSRLAQTVSIPIVVELPENADIYMPTASRYARLAILDALALSVARQTSDKTAENLRRIRASLTAYHGRIGPQPLGD